MPAHFKPAEDWAADDLTARLAPGRGVHAAVALPSHGHGPDAGRSWRRLSRVDDEASPRMLAAWVS